MLFLFSLDAAECRHWLIDLARHLEGEGHEVAFDVRPGPVPPLRILSLILACERRLFRLAGTSPLAPLDPATLPAPRAVPDYHFELSRAGGEGVALFVADTPGMAELPGALMAHGVLPLSFRTRDGRCAAQGVPAISDPDSLWRALEEAVSRIAVLALMASDGQSQHRPVMPRPDPPRARSAARFFLGAFCRKSLARLFPDRFRHEHWRIGVRKRHALPVQDTRLAGESLSLSDFRWIPDDGARYFADPVLFEHEGRTFLFLEEFRYADPRGIIAYTEILPTGEIAFAPRVIIEREGHLSFPLVFEHEGAIYMTPENSAEGHVPLYRARRFPEEWEELEPLIKAPLHDATLLTAGGRFWLLGNLALLDGSSCDALVAYSASAPLGPFEPHPANPLLLDARFTRAGGPILQEDGVQLRAVQDCCNGYGRFLRFCTIEMSPAGDLSLSELGLWQPPPGIAGLHSYARSAQFEAIDVLAARKIKPR